MTTFYVATRARYVLVEAANETEARRLGQYALQNLRVRYDKALGLVAQPVAIQIVRPATDAEIELRDWHREMTGDA